MCDGEKNDLSRNTLVLTGLQTPVLAGQWQKLGMDRVLIPPVSWHPVHTFGAHSASQQQGTQVIYAKSYVLAYCKKLQAIYCCSGLLYS